VGGGGDGGGDSESEPSSEQSSELDQQGLAPPAAAVTSTESIMPRSSCRRKWQCSTVSPGKSVARNRTVRRASNVGNTSRHSPTLT